jgi:hypothetical protein
MRGLIAILEAEDSPRRKRSEFFSFIGWMYRSCSGYSSGARFKFLRRDRARECAIRVCDLIQLTRSTTICEISARLRKSLANWLSKAKRFLRTAGSSAMTSTLLKKASTAPRNDAIRRKASS